MVIIERLKLELNKQDLFAEEEYKQFLIENNLVAEEEYNKEKHYKGLLLTVLDVLEATSNDIDLMRKISDQTTGFSIDAAYKFLEKRIDKIKDKIATMKNDENEDSNISLLFYRN